MLSTSLLRYPGGKSRLVPLITHAVVALEQRPAVFSAAWRARDGMNQAFLVRAGKLIRRLALDKYGVVFLQWALAYGYAEIGLMPNGELLAREGLLWQQCLTKRPTA